MLRDKFVNMFMKPLCKFFFETIDVIQLLPNGSEFRDT